MSNLLTECIELDIEVANNVFCDVCDWLKGLDMSEEADAFQEDFHKVLEKDNPFNSFTITPTNKLIRLIYESAKEIILKRYPDAIVTYSVSGQRSVFRVDDTTYEKAYQERMADW